MSLIESVGGQKSHQKQQHKQEQYYKKRKKKTTHSLENKKEMGSSIECCRLDRIGFWGSTQTHILLVSYYFLTFRCVASLCCSPAHKERSRKKTRDWQKKNIWEEIKYDSLKCANRAKRCATAESQREVTSTGAQDASHECSEHMPFASHSVKK